MLAISSGVDVAADRDRRLVAPADARRVGRVELRFERMDHPRVDRAGADRVDPDALAGDLAGGGLGQPDHRMLRGDIGRHAGGRDQPGDRGGVDDRAPLLLQHDRQHVAQPEKHALDVDRRSPASNIVLVIFGGVRHFAFDAGIVEEAVDRAVGVERRLDIGPHLGRFGDVGGDEACLAALLADDPGGRLAAGAVAVDDDDLGAALGEGERRGAADAVPAPVISATLPVKSRSMASLLSLRHSREKRESRGGCRRPGSLDPRFRGGDASVIFRPICRVHCSRATSRSRMKPRPTSSVKRPSASNLVWRLADQHLGLVERVHVEKDAAAAQIVLRPCGAGHSGAGAHDRHGLAGERLIGRARGPVDRVLQHPGDRVVVFRA